MKKNINNLNSSLDLLISITNKTHNIQSRKIANRIWKKDLNMDNPFWEMVEYKQFICKSNAHLIAIYDKRLPRIGIIGYFGCTDIDSGIKVLGEAVKWLENRFNIEVIYGPINGTATSNYRFNLSENIKFPGEPVNPSLYLEVFKKANFSIANKYVSGLNKYPRIYNKFFLNSPKNINNYKIRSFSNKNKENDLKTYHKIMTTVFPHKSPYCPVLSWEERQYQFKDKKTFFDSNYMYFIEYKNEPVGLINAYPYEDSLVIKTIAIVPKHRGNKLSRLLLKKVEEQSEKDNLKHTIYAMIRVGNIVYRMRKPGIKIIGKYVTFKLEF